MVERGLEVSGFIGGVEGGRGKATKDMPRRSDTQVSIRLRLYPAIEQEQIMYPHCCDVNRPCLEDQSL